MIILLLELGELELFRLILRVLRWGDGIRRVCTNGVKVIVHPAVTATLFLRFSMSSL